VLAGDTAPDDLRRFVAALNGQGKPQVEASLRSFRQRPRDNVAEAYGASFAQALGQLTPGTWAVLESSSGLRAVRLEAQTPGHAATYGEVRDSVYQDWKDDMAGRRTSNAVRELGRKYHVREGAAS
jgi:hypothetical protein